MLCAKYQNVLTTKIYLTHYLVISVVFNNVHYHPFFRLGIWVPERPPFLEFVKWYKFLKILHFVKPSTRLSLYSAMEGSNGDRGPGKISSHDNSTPSSLQYNTHSSRQLNYWWLRCSWSIACRRCSNYIFIFELTPRFNRLHKDNCKTRRETFEFWDFVSYIRDLTVISQGFVCPWYPL